MIVKLVLLLTMALAITFVSPLSALAEVCLDRQPGDSGRFGDSLAANQKYLVIGDPAANRVLVYRRTAANQWTRFRTISPPVNSPISIIGNGFGYRLALSGETLVIGAYAFKDKPQGQEQQLYPFQPPSSQYDLSSLAYNGAVYLTQASSNTPLKRLDQPKAKELAGFSIASDGDKIAFGVSTLNNDGQISGNITILNKDSRLNLPVKGEVALKKNLLVVGSTINNESGQISIFNLETPTLPPKVIKIPMPVSAINLSEKFIIVAEQKFAHITYGSRNSPRTLMLNISTLSSTFIEGIGDISTYGNLLARSYPTTPDSEVTGKVELFDVGITPPKLIKKQVGDIRRSIITKDFLYTVNQNTKAPICIYSLIK
jgi:hypothetical protein